MIRIGNSKVFDQSKLGLVDKFFLNYTHRGHPWHGDTPSTKNSSKRTHVSLGALSALQTCGFKVKHSDNNSAVYIELQEIEERELGIYIIADELPVYQELRTKAEHWVKAVKMLSTSRLGKDDEELIVLTAEACLSTKHMNSSMLAEVITYCMNNPEDVFDTGVDLQRYYAVIRGEYYPICEYQVYRTWTSPSQRSLGLIEFTEALGPSEW